MSIWDLQDKFHDSADDAAREDVRNEMRDCGYHGVADTIQPVNKGGTDWRQEQ